MDNLDRLPKGRSNRDWYSVSVDTLRVWGLVLMVAVLAVGGFVFYRDWSRKDLDRQALETIRQAEVHQTRIERGGAPARQGFEEEFAAATSGLAAAKVSYEQADFAAALEGARGSLDLFQSILGTSPEAQTGSGAAFVRSVEGEVEFRRAKRDAGDWQPARKSLALYPGDHVRTGTGSVELSLIDGTLWTMRPNTQVIIQAKSLETLGEQAMHLDYGWVDLNTARQPSRVVTPSAEARVEGESEAMVKYDAQAKSGLFAAFRGALQVNSSGEVRQVEALQQVSQQGERLSAVQTLPAAPVLETPLEGALFTLEQNSELELRWRPAATGPTRFALQVARDRLFVDRVIDDAQRAKASARLGVRGDGVFHWRVAARSSSGALGAWSPPRVLRVTRSQREEPSAADNKPPDLTLEVPRAYGSIFIVRGRTEAGAIVLVNDERVEVAADGTFTKTVQILKEGYSFIDVRARNAAGREAVIRRRVFVEAS